MVKKMLIESADSHLECIEVGPKIQECRANIPVRRVTNVKQERGVDKVIRQEVTGDEMSETMSIMHSYLYSCILMPTMRFLYPGTFVHPSYWYLAPFSMQVPLSASTFLCLPCV